MMKGAKHHMAKTSKPKVGKYNPSTGKLTVNRGKTISAVEGLVLTPRMAQIFKQSELTGEERRALIRAKFKEQKSA